MKTPRGHARKTRRTHAESAFEIVKKAVAELGPLSPGQMRDLLLDNMPISMQQSRQLVDEMLRSVVITYDGKIMKRNPVMKRSKLTIAQAKAKLAPLGISLNKKQTGEYRVNYRFDEAGGPGLEATAYYTDDLEDAVGSGIQMARGKTMKQNPLKLKPLKSNMTELSIDVPGFRGETKILFSYQTPVAAMNLSPEWHDHFGESCIKTSKKWSVTTSKHINQWLQGAKAAPVDQSILDNLSEGKMKTNPHKRSSKKPLSAKQKAARERFVKMVRSGAFKKRGRNAPKRDPFGGTIRPRKKINPARRKRARKVKVAKFILCLPRIGDSRMWYYGAKANQVTTVKSDAKTFKTEVGALSEARAHKFRLAKHGFFEARTQRI